ncbi:MAG: hypothetical protein P4M15_10355 [Alphaproteobacteria bacterium]|nr:hypothetical protein [Alphaproteobacteria bacterium]
MPISQIRPLVEWVETRMNLMLLPRPAIYISDTAIQRLASFDADSDGTRKIGAYHSGMIYISSDYWQPGNIADDSVIIHELVHYAQDIGYDTYACANAREYEAYNLQNAYLAQHGERPIIDADDLAALAHCP